MSLNFLPWKFNQPNIFILFWNIFFLLLLVFIYLKGRKMSIWTFTKKVSQTFLSFNSFKLKICSLTAVVYPEDLAIYAEYPPITFFFFNPSDFTWNTVGRHVEIKKNKSALVNRKGFIFYNFHFSMFSSSGIMQIRGPDNFKRNKLVELPQKNAL